RVAALARRPMANLVTTPGEMSRLPDTRQSPVKRRTPEGDPMAAGPKSRHDPGSAGPRPPRSSQGHPAMTSSLADRITRRVAHLVVIGQGYVGLPLAVEFARAGFRVTGLDSDPVRVDALNLGSSHVPDVPSEAVSALVESGRYAATGNPAIIAESDVVI